jgi:hypothetical protein
VKHTEPGGYLGSIEMKGKIVHQLESPKQNEEVEDVIENGVRNTDWRALPMTRSVEDTIQNGVKHTRGNENQQGITVEEVIQNGVKETLGWRGPIGQKVEDTIQNGIKNTSPYKDRPEPTVEGVIQNGVKSIFDSVAPCAVEVEESIQDGIKETKSLEHDRTTYHGYFNQERGSHTPLDTVQDVLKNGIKHTQPHVLEILNPIAFEPTLKENKRMNEINNVLEKSIKEVIELPDQSGELNGYGEYYARQKNRAYPHTDTVNDVIRDGIKETHADAYHYIPTVEGVITNNVKETNWRRVDNFPEFEERVIKNGIKA